ncbi:RNA 2',3'-cyclic phosphodiesterase [Edaphobacillus lindanitolerans]|uniref:RNA 2',3'-cyclic phosphodiesterase n=1 Tax=Edaphobacillus lindanitolerans TaxID=550447 RepID=A0A1U7PQW4_9BACI|nr:RNA 2',3'-cyclic phosphodiesterase [Edaphobacillus lindanitolerans]SIT84726.1 2'-5' RNA ligase [Edaphobacillus lindanitolerans]
MQAHYFIGIRMPEQVRPIAEDFQESKDLRKHYKSIPHPEDLHVTLFFIGALDGEKVAALSDSLHSAAQRHAPFVARLDRFDFFGSAAGPRVVYLGFSPSKPLADLQKDVTDAVARSIGAPRKDNRFTPHVTIAKKRKTDEHPGFHPEQLDPSDIAVSSFELFTIHPSRNPKYETVETFKLGG